MNIEYEEFESTEDLLMYLSSVAPPMKNFMPINSYKGFVCSFIPLSQSGGDLYLMYMQKENLKQESMNLILKLVQSPKLKQLNAQTKLTSL